jgi:lipoate-protein ligase A
MLKSRATSLEEVLGRPVTWEEVYRPMPEAFASALGIELAHGELTAEEQAVSSELAVTKYSQDSWNMLR